MDDAGLFEMLFNKVPTPLGVRDAQDGRIVYVNDAMCELMERPREEILGRDPPPFYENPSEPFEIMKILERDGELRDRSVVVFTGRGRRLTINMSMRRIQWGSRFLTLSSFSPIRSADKQEVERHHELLNSVLDHTPHSVFVKDLEGNYIYVNKVCADIAKKTKEQLLGTNFRDLITADLSKHITEAEGRVVKENKVIQYESVYMLDGVPREYLLTKFPLRKTSGEVYAIGAVAADVTDFRSVERELQKSESRFELAVTAAADGIWDWDLASNTIYFSRGWKEMLGYSDTEVAGTMEAWDQLVHPDDLARKNTALQSHLENGKVFNIELRMRRKEGGYVWILVRGQALRDHEQKPVRMIGSQTDIMPQKRVEEELLLARSEAIAASRSKSDFLATISHEIRTPINAILGLSELLRDAKLKKKEQSYVQMLHGSASTLSSLVNDTLDLSKIEAGKLVIQSLPFSLRKMLKEKTGSLRALAEKKGLRWRLHIHRDVPKLLVGDGERLGQIVTNLVSNAIKFTDRGQVTVEVGLKSRKRGLATLHFRVSDTGAGIAESVRPHLFLPFSQGDVKISRKFAGTGLGLSICRKLLQFMGGRIDFQSEEGKGAAFWFEVELGVSSQLHLAKTARLTRPRSTVTGPRCILVVEDNAMNRLLMAEQLKGLKCRVDFAFDGAEGLKKLEAMRYDLVLMDCQMPVMSGIEAARIWRARERTMGLTATPIVAVTATALTTDHDSCLEAGMNQVITKPMSRQTLLEAARRWVPEAKSELRPKRSSGPKEQSFRRRLLQSFGESMAKYSTALDKALKRENRAEVARIAHAIKSSAAALESDRLFKLCAELERIAPSVSWAQIQEVLSKVYAESRHILGESAISKAA